MFLLNLSAAAKTLAASLPILNDFSKVDITDQTSFRYVSLDQDIESIKKEYTLGFTPEVYSICSVFSLQIHRQKNAPYGESCHKMGHCVYAFFLRFITL